MEGLDEFMSVSCGFGSGSGFGGYGYGHGYGSGYGHGHNFDIANYGKWPVRDIDGVPTVITRVRGNVAKGYILYQDLATTPCFVVKQDDLFAHGKTLREAHKALMDKLFDDMPEEERIAEFVKAHKADALYPNTDFFEWHHRLTGSCEIGRAAFVKNHNIDMSGSMTVKEFIKLTENDYGGSTIKKLKEFYR